MISITPRPELHSLFEILGYVAGYLILKREQGRIGDVVGSQERWTVLAAAIVGALFGSRLLGLLEQAPQVHISLMQMVTPGGGKTIVGGLLGGWAGVELAKKMAGIRSKTGDLLALPLCAGIAVGRVGCFWAGLADDTYGKPSSLPWAVDFGDGIGRHPTQAYEILFLLLLGMVLMGLSRRSLAEGLLFRVFMGAYLTWRLVIDFLKPQPVIAGMSVIQWACVAGLVWVVADVWIRRSNVARTVEETYA
jgi:phosphatidylglycerol---prolipoprotein diacylglyceryl transferase